MIYFDKQGFKKDMTEMYGRNGMNDYKKLCLDTFRHILEDSCICKLRVLFKSISLLYILIIGSLSTVLLGILFVLMPLIIFMYHIHLGFSTTHTNRILRRIIFKTSK